jgi:hypothetical protein
MGWARRRTIDLKPLAYLPCFMSQRGDSGQNQMPQPRMKDGMKAEPSCSRQAIFPVSLTITLAQNPKKMPACPSEQSDYDPLAAACLPATTQSCQNMTRAPRMRAGAISAE